MLLLCSVDKCYYIQYYTSLFREVKLKNYVLHYAGTEFRQLMYLLVLQILQQPVHSPR